ncbi:MAG: 23S rRNA (uracil(1939)-C(5))-methyltransferase RlmD, partial [Butyrivibrio sp.]|nr:23S rRNA (uracil(1939)-C(5))-methyltransferase RlmD [Butyrivibrio sp.]
MAYKNNGFDRGQAKRPSKDFNKDGKNIKAKSNRIQNEKKGSRTPVKEFFMDEMDWEPPKDAFKKAGKQNNKDKTAPKKGSYNKQNAEKGFAVKSKKAGSYKEKDNKESKGNSKKSRCPYFYKCGACQMIDVPYEKQLEIKHERVSELLAPFTKVESFIGMDKPDHYRCKVHAVFTHDKKGNPQTGIYSEGTHDVVPIEQCYLENKKADAIIRTVRDLLKSFKIKTFDENNGFGLFRHILIRVGHNSGEIMVVLVLTSPILPSKNNFVKALLKEHPEITTIVLNVNDKQTSMILGDKEKTLYGPGYITDTMCGMNFKISPKSFYQVNPVQTEILYSKAIEFADLKGDELALDCYCGVGTIGIIASPHVKKVIGVELNKDAVKDARINARMNSITNVDFYAKDASEFMVELAQEGGKVDVVFMDPPRSGSTPVFLSSLFKLAP